MDKLEKYRDIVEKFITDYAQYQYAYGQVERQAVCDRTRDQYLLMISGWESDKIHRVHGCIIHISIINGKCWIQRDGTEDGVAYELETAGIPKSDIVLAFHSAEVRHHTGYAVA